MLTCCCWIRGCLAQNSTSKKSDTISYHYFIFCFLFLKNEYLYYLFIYIIIINLTYLTLSCDKGMYYGTIKANCYRNYCDMCSNYHQFQSNNKHYVCSSNRICHWFLRLFSRRVIQLFYLFCYDCRSAVSFLLSGVLFF